MATLRSLGDAPTTAGAAIAYLRYSRLKVSSRMCLRASRASRESYYATAS